MQKRRSEMARLWAVLIVVSGAALLHGCATVAPYERETLAREDMQLTRAPDVNAGTQHATAYREGSAGATGAAGGGCGCN